MADARTRAVREVLSATSVSLLQLGTLAGVPQSTLSRIRSGHLNATAAVAEALATALERLGTSFTQAARKIRSAAPRTRAQRRNR